MRRADRGECRQAAGSVAEAVTARNGHGDRRVLAIGGLATRGNARLARGSGSVRPAKTPSRGHTDPKSVKEPALRLVRCWYGRRERQSMTSQDVEYAPDWARPVLQQTDHQEIVRIFHEALHVIALCQRRLRLRQVLSIQDARGGINVAILGDASGARDARYATISRDSGQLV